MSISRQVQCVDSAGLPTRTMDVVAAHTAPGTLHLACSAVVFGPADTVLVQQRAADKPTFGGLWSNTCCTHPFAGETPLAAAQRRLTEELGITVALEEAGRFRYRAVDPRTGMVEHELDHVFIGHVTSQPSTVPLAGEVDDTAWWSVDEVHARVAGGTDVTPWFDTVVRLAIAARDAEV